MVNIKINGIDVSAKEGTSILEAAKAAGINIPTLCYLKDLNEIGACRICLVEIEGRDKLFAACNCPVEEGISVLTGLRSAGKSTWLDGLILMSHVGYATFRYAMSKVPYMVGIDTGFSEIFLA